jgi:TRAP-type C4-dicarboxylate transport system permease large subunit
VPFLVVQMVVILVITYVPIITLFIPRIAGF